MSVLSGSASGTRGAPSPRRRCSLRRWFPSPDQRQSAPIQPPDARAGLPGAGINAMSSRRPALLTGLASIATYILVLRPRLLRWGASDAELAAPYPGAGVVAGGRRTSTMAVTIDAPPSQVWPWLVQMGCDRAGWYSFDRLDNGGVASGDRVHPEWQQLARGDRLAATQGGGVWFDVAAIEPERFLALRSSLDLGRRGRPYEPSGPRPRHFSDSTWCFRLDRLPADRTRLVVSGYTASSPRALTAVADLLFWEPAHWVMQTRQFANLKRRAEHGRSGHAASPA